MTSKSDYKQAHEILAQASSVTSEDYGFFTKDKKPFIIFIEGADGVGKTTISNYLMEFLKSEQSLVVTKCGIMERTIAGTDIRKINITQEINDELRFVGYCFGTFYGIKDIFETGNADIIIVDRSQASTFAQNICASSACSTSKNSMINIFNELNKDFHEKYNGRFLNIYLEADPKVALKRITDNRGELDVFEKRGAAFQEKIRAGYDAYYSINKTNLLKYNTVQNNIFEIVIDISKNLIKSFPELFK